MPHTRILLASLPPLLRDILGDALAGTAEVELVASGEGEPLEQSVDRLGADVVLVEAEREDVLDPYLSLMYRHPHLKLLALSSDGRRAAMYRLVPDRRVLAEVTPGGIAAAIRAAVDAGGGAER